MPIKMYKIRDKETGKFSSGGQYVNWTKTGKTWNNIGHLKNHLNQLLHYYRQDIKRYPYSNSEIIEIEIKDYDEYFSYAVNDLMKDIDSNKKEMEKKFLEQHEKWREEQDMKQIESLLKKYPNYNPKN